MDKYVVSGLIRWVSLRTTKVIMVFQVCLLGILLLLTKVEFATGSAGSAGSRSLDMPGVAAAFASSFALYGLYFSHMELAYGEIKLVATAWGSVRWAALSSLIAQVSGVLVLWLCSFLPMMAYGATESGNQIESPIAFLFSGALASATWLCLGGGLGLFLRSGLSAGAVLVLIPILVLPFIERFIPRGLLEIGYHDVLFAVFEGSISWRVGVVCMWLVACMGASYLLLTRLVRR